MMESALGCLEKAEGMPPCLPVTGSVKATLGGSRRTERIIKHQFKENFTVINFSGLQIWLILQPLTVLSEDIKCITITTVNLSCFSAMM